MVGFYAEQVVKANWKIRSFDEILFRMDNFAASSCICCEIEMFAYILLKLHIIEMELWLSALDIEANKCFLDEGVW